jgi:SAM-dependent methyltransferase
LKYVIGRLEDNYVATVQWWKHFRRAFSVRRGSRLFRENKRMHADFRRYDEDAAKLGTRRPVWRERLLIGNEATGSVNYEPHYTYHCSWACRVLAETKPAHHVDIGSAMMFVGMASAWVPLTHYDYRRPEITLPGLEVGTADLLALPFADNSIESLSCMHVIEHIGLGRYGDPIDAKGDARAARELTRVLAPGGRLLMVTPVGCSKIAFNAHRIYAHDEIASMFAGLRLDRFDLLIDGGAADGLIEHADPALVEKQRWGCGCFVFRKDP